MYDLTPSHATDGGAPDGRRVDRTAHQQSISEAVDYWFTARMNRMSDHATFCAALARQMHKVWVKDSLPDQMYAIQVALRALGQRDPEDDAVRLRRGRLAFLLEDQPETEVRTGRALKRAFGRYQLHNGELWVGFRKEHDIVREYYREPSLIAYEAVLEDGGWHDWVPELETAEEPALSVPELGEMTITQLAEQIGWPGGPRALVAALPQIRATYGWLAEPMRNPATGKLMRDATGDHTLYRVSIPGPPE